MTTIEHTMHPEFPAWAAEAPDHEIRDLLLDLSARPFARRVADEINVLVDEARVRGIRL